MGLAMATAAQGREALLGRGFLANIRPSEFATAHQKNLPEEIKVDISGRLLNAACMN
jgi:hypothetical protein